MPTSRFLCVTTAGLALSALAGWISVDAASAGDSHPAASPHPAPHPAASIADNTTSRPFTASHEPALEALALPASSSGLRRVIPRIQLSDQQREILALDPVAAVRESIDATRKGKRADCKQKLPHASDEYCERILQVDGRTGVKFIAIQQAFLTGQMDQDTYQAETHKTFLEHEIALETFMPPRDFLAHEGLAPGDDIFINLMGEFQTLPPGYKMGDEVFDPSINPFADTRGASTPSTAPAATGDPPISAKEKSP